ncbi:MaoC family dehydratase [Mycolicibacillus trivialis]|uniref:Dehydratase n=1 Tax=Mycolicibacillus trivialis TaxID=1798 RepID=A0A1X2EGZ1_9MYCO|nr:MaoC family dehydratase [Mycolicibacillus trivialis]ORX01670.1 dehydratase [Mycolicibacillus trivialis]
MRVLEIAELAGLRGEPIGTTDWLTISQSEVNLFADATGDHQWIHVDPERAADGPFGTTIVHGYLTLALLPRFHHALFRVDGVKLAINYGLNKVRFPAPVPVGARIRAAVTVAEVTDLGDGAHQVTLSTTVEIKDAAKPACVAESIVRYQT